MPTDTLATSHFRSVTCQGVYCGICRRAGQQTEASHKVGEEIPDDYPLPAGRFSVGHNLTQYVCCRHFVEIVGPAAREWRGCPRE